MIIPTLNVPNFSWENLKREYQFEHVRLAYSAADRMAMIINSRLAEYMFKGSGYSLESIHKMQVDNNIKSFPLCQKISFKGEFEERDFITSNIVGMIEEKEYTADAITRPTTNNIIEIVKENKHAIGYGEDIVHARINGVESTEENVNNNSYPISRYLYFYTVDTRNDNVNKFIQWVIGKDGQQIVKRFGYIPIWRSSY